MSKKKRKCAVCCAQKWAEEQAPGDECMGPAMAGFGAHPGANKPGWDAAAPGRNGHGYDRASFLHGLHGMFGSRPTEQFIIGALVGAATVYVLSDEELRAKIMKGIVKLYANVAGGIEELKEQMADIKAEVAAERHNAA